MNGTALLLAPWRASPRWTRWYVGGILAVATVAAVLVGVFAHRASWPMLAGGVLAFGEFFAGMFLLAPGLLLAVDARQLRLPGLERVAALGLAWPALALIAVRPRRWGWPADRRRISPAYWRWPCAGAC